MPAVMHLPTHRLIDQVLCASLLSILGAACSQAGAPMPAGSVLFQDDFSRSSSGWEIQHRADAIHEYRDGLYAMLALSPHTSSWSTPGLEVGAARIEVDALQIGGPEDNLFGVVCRYRDDGNFVFLVASSDGFAGIGSYHEGRRELFGGAALLPAASILPAGSTNHLAADCLEDTLRLYVNGALAAEAVSVGGDAQGDIGLIVSTYLEPGVEFVFDNFSARVPEPEP
jgi:hypothetical protein